MCSRNNDAAMLVDGYIININVTGGVGDLRHIEPVKSIASLSDQQNVLKPPYLIELTQLR